MQAWQGVNAITKAIPIMQGLRDLDARLNQQSHPAFADIEHPINLNIGVIHGGDWPSTVPGACELHCRLSCYPGQTVEETRQEIETAVRSEEHTSELQSRQYLVCRLLLEKKKKIAITNISIYKKFNYLHRD